MTTSYSDTVVSSVGNQPNEDSKGHLVWSPTVGHYYQYAKDQRESYGGIVGALQDYQEGQGNVAKAYPHNFAGIIAAIQDMAASQNLPPVSPGPNPGGGQLNPDGDWIQIIEPEVGSLWFDTRQGRLFVYVNKQWVQTNGADGLPQITPDETPPNIETPAPGQFYYDSQSGALFIHDGRYVAEDGTIIEHFIPDSTPLWRVVNEDVSAAMQTTATLPLAVIGTRVAAADGTYLPDIDLEQVSVQKDYNEWLFEALVNLDTELTDLAPVIVSELPPDTPKVGQLWYDTATLDMSVWYVDEDGTAQWVPTSAAYTYDEDLAVVSAALAEETRLREISVQGVYQHISNLDISSNSAVTNLQTALSNLSATVAALNIPDIQPLATKSELATVEQELDQKIEAIVVPDLEPYATKSYVTNRVSYLETEIDQKASTTELQTVEAKIPSVSSFVTQDDITTAISNITTEYLPRTGGTLTGSFVMQKDDYSKAGLDFSTSPSNSKNAFKFQAVAPTTLNYSTFGTTEKFWEQAWNFAAEEDFCWIYSDTNKVFSITKDGPACSQLYIGDFGDNDLNGRVIHNKIDVKERLNTYQTTFEQLRQSTANASTFDELKEAILTALANV